MDSPRPELDPDATVPPEVPEAPDDLVVPVARAAVRSAVEAASRAEAEALRAHRRAMALSMRAARAHEQASLMADRMGMSIQASLHANLAGRARDAARAELGLDILRIQPGAGSSA